MPSFTPEELARWAHGRWTRLPPDPLHGVGTDTRGDLRARLFIALRGERHDAHDYVGRALEAGAAAALVEERRLDSLPADRPLLVVRDTRAALRDLAAGHRSRLGARFIGITGSVGKTTVKEMTADLLQCAGPAARTPGNWNNDIGLPLGLLAMEPGNSFGVFELGMNHPGELAPLCRILRHECGVVTTVGVAHAEFFPDVEAIAREKAEVLRAVPADGVVVLGAAEPHRGILCDGAVARVVTVALDQDADYRAIRLGGTRFEVVERASMERALFDAPWPGAFLVYDALLAIAVARQFGLGWEPMAAALARCRPLKLRGQETVVEGVCFVNDAYNANPLSMRAALQAFRERTVRGRRWLALGGMGELGARAKAEHRAVGEEAARLGFEGLVAVGALAEWIAEGAERAGFPGEVVRSDGAAAAVEELRARVRAGDAVLLKGSRSERMEEVLHVWAGAVSVGGGSHE